MIFKTPLINPLVDNQINLVPTVSVTEKKGILPNPHPHLMVEENKMLKYVHA